MDDLILKETSVVAPPVQVFIDPGPRVMIAIGSPGERDAISREDEFCYWQVVGVHNDELLSFDLDLDTGQVFSIEVILYRRPVVTRSELQAFEGISRTGVPVFDVDAIATRLKAMRPPKRQDVFEDFQLELHGTDLHIVLADALPTGENVVSARLHYLFDSENRLCRIILSDLEQRDIEQLCSSETETGPVRSGPLRGPDGQCVGQPELA